MKRKKIPQVPIDRAHRRFIGQEHAHCRFIGQDKQTTDHDVEQLTSVMLICHPERSEGPASLHAITRHAGPSLRSG